MESHDIRDQVSRAYTEALRRATEGSGGCCGGKPADERRAPVEAAARDLAGYGDASARFEEASQSSFGCGNPLAFAGVAPGETVLDLGSGAGFDLLVAAERVGSSGRVIGVDMTDAMIERARANVASAGFDNVEIRRGIIEELPVDDASVDWVISNCVINLSPEKPRVFGEIARVLKPGGRFSISDIVADELPIWLRESAAAYSACVAGAIPERDYVAGLEASGLEQVAVTERLVYDREQLRAMTCEDAAALGIDAARLDEALDAVTGRVASIEVTGRRAAH